jgi:uncharacterized protein YutE (UPF0331/DUF86 family)
LKSKNAPFYNRDTPLVDTLLIGRKLAEMDMYLGQAREYAGISLDAYEKDWKTQRVVERTLQILIEACIDIANHIISDRGMRLPTTYADIFRVLRENRIIPEDLSKNMENMARFRNLIVHQYETIDSSIVVSILHKNLEDFERFRNAILKTIPLHS